MGGLTAAVRTLTSIPFPGKEDGDLGSAIPWFPVVGMLLGLLLWLAGFLWAMLPFPGWSYGCAMLLVILDALMTRGLHLDGLADWADSMGGFGREQRLSIMKDVSMGAFGTIALVSCLMTKWILFQRLTASGTYIWIIPVMVISRSMMVELMTTLPYARSGDGMARPFVDNGGKGRRAISLVIAVVLCLVSGPVGIGLFFIAWAITMGFRAYCIRAFGGVTGDLLGAADEIVEVALLALCAVPGSYMTGTIGWGGLPWI